MNYLDIQTIEDLVLVIKDFEERNPSGDISLTKQEIIFPLIELLGYDTTDPSQFINCQVFDLMGSDSFDYEMIKDNDGYRTNCVVKVVDKSEDFTNHHQLIQDAFKLYNGIGYAVITNGPTLAIYEAPKGKNIDLSKLFIEPLKIIDFNDIKEEDISILRLLSKDKRKLSNTKIQAVRYDDEEEEEEEETPAKNKKKKEIKIPKLKLFVPLIVGAVLVGGTLFLLKDGQVEEITNQPTIEENKEAGVQVGAPNDLQAIDQNSYNADIQYINIKSILEVNVSQPQNRLVANLITDILEGAIIKFEFYCGNEKLVTYGVIDKNGQCSIAFDIPEIWENPNVNIATYMRFDESEKTQPKNVTNLYGERGQYIIQKADVPMYGIISGTTTHDNINVRKYIKKQEEEKLNQLAKDVSFDFSQVEYRVDSGGNIKIVPKGYSLDHANIKENRFIYPQIYYDKQTNKANIYFVCGYVGRDLIFFRAVSFTANDHKWGYQNGANPAEVSVNGGIASEWIYFNNEDTPKILNDMRLLSNANSAEVIFSGSQRKAHTLTTEEQSNIKYFLYLYEKYFEQGFNIPTQFLGNSGLTPVNLEYIKKPNTIRARLSSERKDVEALESKLASGTISSQEKETLQTMNKTFKTLSGEIITSLMNEINYSTGAPTLKLDIDNKDYITLYFDYNSSGLEEQGFIKEVILYSDKIAHIQIKSKELQADSIEPSHVEIKLSDYLFNQITTYLATADYKKF